MRVALIALALIPAASTAAEDRPANPVPAPINSPSVAISPYLDNCPSETARIAEATKMRPGFHKLTDLPDANAYSAVFRTKEGCPDPVVISYEVGKARR